MPNQLLLKTRQVDSVIKELFTSNEHSFNFNNNLGINLDKAKSLDCHQLLIEKNPHWEPNWEREVFENCMQGNEAKIISIKVYS